MSDKRDMTATVLAELVSTLRDMQSQQTDTWDRIKGGLTNQTISAGSHVIASAGYWSDQFNTQYGSVFVVNHSNNDMVFTNSAPAGLGATNPGSGTGTAWVLAKSSRVINMAGMAYTIYGTAGDVVDVEIFSKPQPPLANVAEPGGVSSSQVTVVTAAAPAAGTDFSITVPAGESWQLLSIRYSLTTSIAAANRLTSITFDNGTSVFCKVPSTQTQTASLTTAYDAMVDIGSSSSLLGTDVYFAIPRLILPAGYRIRTSTLLIDAGDQYSSAIYCYLRYV